MFVKIKTDGLRSTIINNEIAYYASDVIAVAGKTPISEFKKNGQLFAYRVVSQDVTRNRQLVLKKHLDAFNAKCPNIPVVDTARAELTPVAELDSAVEALQPKVTLNPEKVEAKLQAPNFQAESAGKAEINSLVYAATDKKAKELGISKKEEAAYGDLRSKTYRELYDVFDDQMREVLTMNGTTLWEAGLGRGNKMFANGDKKPSYATIVCRAGYLHELLIVARAFFGKSVK